MGYYLNALGNIPLDKEIDFYIFIINGQFRDELYDIIDRNFPNLAASIGSRAVIARGTQPAAFSSDVARKYLGKDHRALFHLIPALLITNAHPNELSDESLRLLVPLREAEKRFEGWSHFFKLLSDFAQGKDDAFLSRFQSEESALDVANRVVTLNPTVFGCGINLNAFIDWWRSRPSSFPAPQA
jgi:hypothetical protein